MITLTGQIYATEDIQRALSCIPLGVKNIYIGDPDPDIDKLSHGTIIYGSILTPPYTALQQVIDGNIAGFAEAYTEHLNTQEAQMMITTIIYALYRGVNIQLIFPKDTGDLKYPDFLLKFIAANLGIIIGTDAIPFQYNPTYSDIILDLLYRNDCISPHEYIYYADNVTELSLHKLINQLEIKVTNPRDVNEYIRWVEGYHDRMNMAQSFEMITPFKVDPLAAR